MRTEDVQGCQQVQQHNHGFDAHEIPGQAAQSTSTRTWWRHSSRSTEVLLLVLPKRLVNRTNSSTLHCGACKTESQNSLCSMVAPCCKLKSFFFCNNARAKARCKRASHRCCPDVILLERITQVAHGIMQRCCSAVFWTTVPSLSSGFMTGNTSHQCFI
jgi:hypothetical protein